MKTKKIIFLLCFMTCCYSNIFSLQLIPMKFSLTPSGRDSNVSVTVKNQNDEVEAVQLFITTRNVDINGNENNEEEEDNFLIYPPQIILAPHTQKTVRISWIGDLNLEEELSFRLIAEQLPINLEENNSENGDENNPALELKLLFRYEAAFYVTPKNSLANVVIDSVEEITSEDGNRFAAITFFNNGNRHKYLLDMHLTINALDDEDVIETITLTPDDIQKLGTWNVLANSKRRFMIPLPEDFPQDHTITASYKLG